MCIINVHLNKIKYSKLYEVMMIGNQYHKIDTEFKVLN